MINPVQSTLILHAHDWFVDQYIQTFAKDERSVNGSQKAKQKEK